MLSTDPSKKKIPIAKFPFHMRVACTAKYDVIALKVQNSNVLNGYQSKNSSELRLHLTQEHLTQ